jgi:hypothetical protein
MRKTEDLERPGWPGAPLSSVVFRKAAKPHDSRLAGVPLVGYTFNL